MSLEIIKKGTKYNLFLTTSSIKAEFISLLNNISKTQIKLCGDSLIDQELSLEFQGRKLIEKAKYQNNKQFETSLFFCKTCNKDFPDVIEQRTHFQHECHRNNVKKLLSCQNTAESNFNDIVETSSISGTDSDEDSNQTIQMTNIIKRIRPLDIKSNEEEEEIPQKEARITGTPQEFIETDDGKVLVVYKALILPHEKDGSLADFLISSLHTPPKWTIILISGNHFAAAIFQGTKEIVHKSIHKYTIRAKQGGSQSLHDNSGKGGKATAGSILRRHNEKQLELEIRDLLVSWKSEIDSSQLIFYRASGSRTKNILFGGKIPILEKKNSNCCSIPFTTGRPTFKELKNVLRRLATVHVFDKADFLSLHAQKEKPNSRNSSLQAKKKPKKSKKKNLNRGISRSPKLHEEPEYFSSLDEGSSGSELSAEFFFEQTQVDLSELKEFDDSLTTPGQHDKGRNKKREKKMKEPKITIVPTGIVSKILLAMKNDEIESSNATSRNLNSNDLSSLIIHLKEEYSSKLLESERRDELILEFNQFIDDNNSTVLHRAAKKNQLELIWILLECGCDPTFKDKTGKYPYNYSGSKESRNLFRKFRAQYPDKYDYNKAQIPEPLTDEVEKEKIEKKKLLNKLRREKEKAKKLEKKEMEDELEEQQRFINLSDREKRALAAERRLLGQCKKNFEVKPILLRCFDCGIDITGKVPFEYNLNKFCSTKCLATHRKKFPTPLSL